MCPPGNPSHLVLGAAPHHHGIGLYLAGLAFLLIFLGVVLPAVWSTKPARRAAAITVLAHILNTLRPRPLTRKATRLTAVPGCFGRHPSAPHEDSR